MKQTAVVLTATICLLMPGLAAAEDRAAGYVFDDQNGNALRDPGEPGIPDVRVSNGRDVVATDAEGRYELPVDDDTILFVIKPRNWMTPVNGENLPRFYYIHKPAGSPKLRYGGVEPTGPLPASIDFPLRPQHEPDRFEVLLFGDSQPYSLAELDYFAHDVVEQLVGIDVAFGMSLGDLVGDHLDLHEPLNRTVAHIGVPFYNVLGNHDMDYTAADDRYADDPFERVYGPSYYAFDYGPVHFIVLDDVVWHGKTHERKGYYKAGLGEKQLAFLRSDLEHVPADRLVVLTMHIPIVEIAEREALFELLAGHPHTVSFSAHEHYHRHWFIDQAQGWKGPRPHHHSTLATTCGSWWKGAPDELGIPHAMMPDGSPNGWFIATFDGNRYAYRFQAARRPATCQMHIHTPEVVKAAEAETTDVLVNVFVGSERSTVQMRFDAGPWQALERVECPDPYFAALKALEESDTPPHGQKLPRIMNAPHIWGGKLPANPAAGSHLIEVRTTDMFGQTYTGRRIVRVE